MVHQHQLLTPDSITEDLTNFTTSGGPGCIIGIPAMTNSNTEEDETKNNVEFRRIFTYTGFALMFARLFVNLKKSR